jgi:hypothetical protein
MPGAAASGPSPGTLRFAVGSKLPMMLRADRACLTLTRLPGSGTIWVTAAQKFRRSITRRFGPGRATRSALHRRAQAPAEHGPRTPGRPAERACGRNSPLRRFRDLAATETDPGIPTGGGTRVRLGREDASELTQAVRVRDTNQPDEVRLRGFGVLVLRPAACPRCRKGLRARSLRWRKRGGRIARASDPSKRAEGAEKPEEQ